MPAPLRALGIWVARAAFRALRACSAPPPARRPPPAGTPALSFHSPHSNPDQSYPPRALISTLTPYPPLPAAPPPPPRPPHPPPCSAPSTPPLQPPSPTFRQPHPPQPLEECRPTSALQPPLTRSPPLSVQATNGQPPAKLGGLPVRPEGRGGILGAPPASPSQRAAPARRLCAPAQDAGAGLAPAASRRVAA